MANLACAAWGYRGKSWRQYCEIASSMGITNLEIQLSRGSFGHVSLMATDGEIQEIKRVASEIGVKVVALAGSSDFTSTDPLVLEERIDFAQQQIELTSRLGAEVIRLFTGGHNMVSVPPEIYTRAQYAFNRIGEFAQSKGVSISIENHGGPTADGSSIAKLMQGITSAAVGINYDPANFAKIGADPITGLYQCMDWINYSHWKDVKWLNGDTVYCAVGEGYICWERIVPLLAQSNFKGYWAIEYEVLEDVDRGTKDSLVYLKNVLGGN